ncbi:MAG TPA: aminodeoxychorismate synthase component I, partial [Cytophagales bacterium]|nr:aminodeoxychorismate synthase component I [Cytophagales bacterium]
EINDCELLFDFNGVTNANNSNRQKQNINLEIQSKFEDSYKVKFKSVVEAIQGGNSFLVNLTVKHPIVLSHSLLDVFYASRAKYKMYYKEEFVVFSPEPFVQIRGGKIYAYPMKGTIDASLKDADKLLQGNDKEMAEHVTIVDLIRSDLSRVASNVNVNKFRYIEKIESVRGSLLQASSEIEGTLPDNYREKIGDVIIQLLPAGSVSGAPKTKTVELISKTEGEPRGFYTGVCGVFDGKELDTGVMIRYIEKKDDGYYYRSGGGITSRSKCQEEYEEVIKKIYVPIN